MNINPNTLIKWSGLAAILSGILYILTQVTHPAETLVDVTTNSWLLAHSFSLSFSATGLFGITGIYLKQAKKVGLLGLIAYLMFFLGLVLLGHFIFIEIFILPALVTEAPAYATEFLAVVNGKSNLATLNTLFGINALLYLGGGLLFGLSMLRAGVHPRWAALLFTFGAIASLSGAFDERLGRFSTIFLSLGLIGLGFNMLIERTQKQVSPAILSEASA